MDAMGILIKTPENFVAWCDRYSDNVVKLRPRGAAAILDTLAAQGKTVYADTEGRLYIGGGAMVSAVSLDEIVDQACDWNYKALVDVRDRKGRPADFLDYCTSCTREKELEECRFILDRIFRQTDYGRSIKDMARELAIEIIKEMKLVPGFDPDKKDVREDPDAEKDTGEEFDWDREDRKLEEFFVNLQTDEILAGEKQEERNAKGKLPKDEGENRKSLPVPPASVERGRTR